MTIRSGVPFGMKSAVHASVWRSGRPASVDDGMFGSEGARAVAVTTIGFTAPDVMCGRRADHLVEQRIDLPADQIVVGLGKTAVRHVLDVGVAQARDTTAA